MNHSKTLTHEQQLWRDRLFERDLAKKRNTYKIKRQNKSFKVELKKTSVNHSPKKVVEFLKLFSTNETALKYTNHLWDERDGSYKWKDFDSFFNDYKKDIVDFEKKNGALYELRPELHYLIRDFLFERKEERKDKTWGENKIKVGFCHPKDVIKNWMNDNPGKEPAAMPVTEFEKYGEEYETEFIGNEQLAYFSEITELFKHVIAFRDNDLLHTIKRVFRGTDYSIKKSDEELEKELIGKTFYTLTQQVKDALRIIEKNISARPEFNKIDISAKKEKNYLSLIITHIGSYSNKSVDDDKLNLRSGLGQMIDIKNKLRSLCDFSVISKFRGENDEISTWQIDYLYTDNFEAPPRFTNLSDDCEGFSYILKFYL